MLKAHAQKREACIMAATATMNEENQRKRGIKVGEEIGDTVDGL